MNTILFVVVGLVGFLVVAFFLGRPAFWKLAKKHPVEALNMYRSEDCWHVFESKPPNGYKSALPPGEWSGPFLHFVPSQDHPFVVYGREPEFNESQKQFMLRFRGN